VRLQPIIRPSYTRSAKSRAIPIRASGNDVKQAGILRAPRFGGLGIAVEGGRLGQLEGFRSVRKQAGRVGVGAIVNVGERRLT
jgi:hypothetical protein